MEIRKLEIDLDNELLKINGKEIKDIPVIVALPAMGAFSFSKLFNSGIATCAAEECDKLEVSYFENYRKAVNSKLL
ncbi:MAG: hypothetical protein K2N01_01335 [Lachnospiraceae bacterium]|nr:hypothetical protein [Lachnospiraceae bacterium]